jgi:hypothetical protein
VLCPVVTSRDFHSAADEQAQDDLALAGNILLE